MNLSRPKMQLFIGWLTLFVIGTDLFVVSPILPFIAQQFDMSPATAGLMVTMFSIMYSCGAPLFGSLADRFGRKQLIVIGLLVFTAANVITSVSTSFWLLLVSRILAGTAAASITPSIYAITGDVAPPEKRASWLGAVNSGLLMALWAGAPLGTFLQRLTNWHLVFIILAVLSLLLAPLNQKAWPKVKAVAGKIGGKGFLNVLSSVSVTICWGTAVYGIYTFLGTELLVQNHFTTGQIMGALFVYGIGAMTGSLYGGAIADKFTTRRVTTVSLFGLFLALEIVGMIFTQGYWIYLMLIVWAFFGYAFWPAFQARLAQGFTQNRGVAMAWNSTALYIGMTIGSLMGSAVIVNWGFGILPYICGAVALLGVLLNQQKIGENTVEAKASATVGN